MRVIDLHVHMRIAMKISKTYLCYTANYIRGQVHKLVPQGDYELYIGSSEEVNRLSLWTDNQKQIIFDQDM